MRFVAMLCIWAMALAAHAADWKLLTTSTDLKKITYWYGPDNTEYLSTTYISYVDCSRRLLAFTANTYYSDFESTSAPVHQEDELPLTDLNFAPPRPGTPGEMRINYLCQSYEGSSSKSI
jgi:hypothetical protein